MAGAADVGDPDEAFVFDDAGVGGAVEFGDPGEQGFLRVEPEEGNASVVAAGSESAAGGEESAVAESDEFWSAEGFMSLVT